MGTDETQTDGRIYFDGQPFEGIKEAEFVPELIDDAPENPVRIAPTAEISLAFTPEQAAAVAEAAKTAAEALTRICRDITEWAREVIRKVAAVATQRANAFMDRMLYEANDNPRWWYLYKHAKKYRTRKKYRRLLMKQLIRRLEAASKGVNA